MEIDKDYQIMSCQTLDELLEVKYGENGTHKRNESEKDTQIFCLATVLKDERLKAGLTQQQQLAERIGTKKTYISRLENGKADVQLNTLSSESSKVSADVYL